ncbi:MAG: hypothetical protein DPW18_13770 [Chloroflexi bacterium]|nr:hypothetical protein [Chloroflexota bacterium]MDL1944459.1 hypothetical protein [Chloroflexi bacterium CFX2]
MNIDGVTPVIDLKDIRAARALLDEMLNKLPLGDSKHILKFPKQSILYPTAYRFNKVQFSALRNAAQAMGEQECYLSILQNYKHNQNMVKDWVVSLQSEGYLLFAKGNMVLENILYSAKKTWAVIFHTDDLAIIGGEEGFVASFLEALPSTEDEQVKHYLDDCKYYAERMEGFDFDGLLIFLENIFGKEKTQYLLKASNIVKPQ